MSVGKVITKNNLTRDQLDSLIKVAGDVFFFFKHLFVIHPVRGKVPFDLYPFQKRTLWYFLTKRFNIVLKFRQAGVTELIAGYCLWLTMYHPNKSVVIISIKDRVAKKVLRKIKYMYRNLPEHLKVRVVNGRPGEIGTAQEVEFSNGSLISSVPTTEEAGRSEALSLLVIDEAAIIRWANTIWAAASPTLSTGGASIVNSTPYGMGNWFHSEWVKALSGGSEFNPIRLRWQMHPERDDKWYNSMSAALGPRRTAQEIDGDFLTSGNSVFDLLDIRAIEDSLSDFPVVDTSYGGSLLLFGKPKRHEKYFIGADIATGRSRHYSAFTIYDRQGEEWGVFKKKIPVGKFADLLMNTGKTWNNAQLAPESNDIGLAVTTKIEEAGYRNLFYATAFLRKKGKKRTETKEIPGWYTTSKNRPVIIDGLEEDIRLNNITVKDPYFIQEAYTFIYDDRNKPIAMGKNSKGSDADDLSEEADYNDDSILGKAISNQIRKGKIKGSTVLPR